MTQRQLTALLCRFLGLYAVMQALGAVGTAVQWVLMALNSGGGMFSGGNWLLLAATSLGPPILQASFGIVLIMFADAVAIYIVPDSNAVATISGVSAREISNIAFSIVGLLMVCWTLPRLVDLVVAIYMGTNMRTNSPYSSSGTYLGRASGLYIGAEPQIGQIASCAVQLILGIVLFLRYRVPTRSIDSVNTSPVHENPAN